MKVVGEPTPKADLTDYVKVKLLDDIGFNQTYIVEGLTAVGRVYQYFGGYKQAKTLVVMDMAMCSSKGSIWGNRRTIPTLVIYVAGEAVEDVQMRAAAWRLYNEVEEDLPFYIRVKPVFLTSQEWAIRLRTEVQELQDINPDLPTLIVIDTLARNFGAGVSENDDAGMGAFVNNFIDQVIRPTGAAGIVVHHTGHSNTDRGRGHSSFAAAVDGSVKVSKEGRTVTVCATEMRSSAGDDAMSFRIVVQELPGQDNFGNVAEAPVLVFTGDQAPKKQGIPKGKNQKALIELLRTLHTEHQERIDKDHLNVKCRVSKTELYDEAIKREATKDSGNTYRAISTMLGKGLLTEKTYPDSEAVYLFVTEDYEEIPD